MASSARSPDFITPKFRAFAVDDPESGGISAPGAVLDSPPTSLYNAPRFAYARRQAGIGAQVAQLVEHAIENRSVGGSIPPLGTKNFG